MRTEYETIVKIHPKHPDYCDDCEHIVVVDSFVFCRAHGCRVLYAQDSPSYDRPTVCRTQTAELALLRAMADKERDEDPQDDMCQCEQCKEKNA